MADRKQNELQTNFHVFNSAVTKTTFKSRNVHHTHLFKKSGKLLASQSMKGLKAKRQE